VGVLWRESSTARKELPIHCVVFHHTEPVTQRQGRQNNRNSMEEKGMNGGLKVWGPISSERSYAHVENGRDWPV